MSTHSWKLLQAFAKLGAVGSGVAASVAATVAVANAASPICEPEVMKTKQRFNIPESSLPPFKKWNFNWDRLEPGEGGKIWPDTVPESADSGDKSSSPKAKPTARRNIILVRHGQYNMGNCGDDDEKHTLTELGQEQAALVGKRLGLMGIKFTSIISSNMTRAKQTAKIMLENMESQKLELKTNDPLLNEGAPCVPEPPYRNPDQWNPEQRDIYLEGSRIETAFRKYFHRAPLDQEEDSWEIIVCHGNVIRYFSCRALQFPPEGWLRISIDHCSISRFTILPTGEVVLRGLGDSGHLPFDKATVG